MSYKLDMVCFFYHKGFPITISIMAATPLVSIEELHRLIPGSSPPMGALSQTFTAITQDTRDLTDKTLFLVKPGKTVAASEIAKKAISHGARLLITEEPLACENQWVVPSIQSAESILCDVFYPQQPNTLVAITGTDGKTSVSGFLKQLWALQNLRCASIGTLGVHGHPETSFSWPLGMTTPNGVFLRNLLHQLAKTDVQQVVLEASSHGLSQGRLHGLKLTTGVFTNFSQDHLDYHRTLEAYWNAKASLFTQEGLRYGVIHHRLLMGEGFPLKLPLSLEICGYGPKPEKPLTPTPKYPLAFYEIILQEGGGQRVRFIFPDLVWEGYIPLVGAFQAENLLAALTVLWIEGVCLLEIFPLLSGLRPIPGRMEYVGSHRGAHIYVDYAHTPVGLETALKTLQAHGKRVGVVFGCGGDRDASKRRLMGEVAATHSHWTVVTDDNPRHEDPSSIRKEVLEGCPKAVEIPLRQEAIAYAMSCLEVGDVLLIAGKGHETVQLIGSTAQPFSDVAWVQFYIDTHKMMERDRQKSA